MYNLSENVKMNIEGYCMYRKIVKEMNKWKNDFKKPLMLVGIKQMRINILIRILTLRGSDNFCFSVSNGFYL